LSKINLRRSAYLKFDDKTASTVQNITMVINRNALTEAFYRL